MKRKNIAYPGIAKNANLKSRQDNIDFDYLDRLSPNEKTWLSNFMDEYGSAWFRHDGEILHNTPELKKSCYDKNNSRNRDLYSRSKARSHLHYLDDCVEEVSSTNDVDIQELLNKHIDDSRKVILRKKKD